MELGLSDVSEDTSINRETKTEPSTADKFDLNGSLPDSNPEMRAISLSKRSSPLYAFSFRNFRLFFVGQSISVAGSWMQTVAQQWLVWQLTHSPKWLGIVNGA